MIRPGARARRPPVRLGLAGALGVGAALLVACAGSSNPKLIPANNANQLKADFDAVASAVAAGGCAQGVPTAVAQARRDLAALPATVDPRLAAALASGVRTLTGRAPVECQQAATTTTQTTTTPPTTTTSTTPTTTNTTPTTTNTTPTTTIPTTTIPTTTDTTPTTTIPTTSTPTDTAPTGTGTTPGIGGGTPAPNGSLGQTGRALGGGTTGGAGATTGSGGGN